VRKFKSLFGISPVTVARVIGKLQTISSVEISHLFYALHFLKLLNGILIQKPIENTFGMSSFYYFLHFMR
jgi:hypothetical protein